MSHEQTEPSTESISGRNNYTPAGLTHSGERRRANGVVFPLERFLVAKVLHAFGDPPVDVVLWNRQTIPSRRGNAVARVLIRDRGALFRLVADPELNFGELYSAERIEVRGNLLNFLEAVYKGWPLPGQNRIDSLLAPINDARRNSLSGSRRNIQHHYDIGNDFYKLWLDERMLYTCAYFPTRDSSLEEAQLAKMDHVCRKMRLQPGEKVVEAGCGWGSLAMQ